ncbi:MAG TPA: hypothetical protein VGW34_10045 [Allosphingosinicella sp.]|nr:hypothetical protein [Allosphingosinicella sp.]
MKALGWVASPLLSAVGVINKSPKAPSPLPAATRDDARGAIADQDEIRRRRGGAADIITGAAGAEAAPGTTGKATLGS